MSRIFAITSASDALPLAAGRGEISFTVSNTSSRPIRGRARPVALGETKQEWLTVAGENERDFSSEGTHQFTVSFAAPTGTPAGKYPFRLDVVSVVNPDEDFTEGPPVTAEVAASSPPPVAKPFPWWIIPVVLGVLLVGGLLTWLALRDGGEPANANQANNASTPTPSPTPTPRTFDGTWVNVNPNTRDVTRIVIQQSGSVVDVHAFGSCSPTDCDWGTQRGSMVADDKVTVGWNFAGGAIITNLELTLQPDGRMRMIGDTVFRDTRPRQRSDELFEKRRFRPGVADDAVKDKEAIEAIRNKEAIKGGDAIKPK